MRIKDCTEGEFYRCYIIATEDEMRIRLVIDDAEYRNALLQAISVSDKEMLAEVSDSLDAESGYVYVTDDAGILEMQGGETDGCVLVYISEHAEDRRLEPPGPYVLFKYEQLDVIIQELILCNYLVTGQGLGSLGAAKLIAVCSDGFVLTGGFAEKFARKLMYRTDSKVLVLSLRCINTCGTADGDPLCIHKLYYYFRKNGDVAADAFVRADSYDVQHLMCDDGWNFLTDLGYKEIEGVLISLRKSFDYIVLDIGENYSRVNIEILDSVDSVVYLCADDSRHRFDLVMGTMIKEYKASGNVAVYKPGSVLDDMCDTAVNNYLKKEG